MQNKNFAIIIIIISLLLPLMTYQYVWYEFDDKCYVTGAVNRLEKWKINECKNNPKTIICNNCHLNIIEEDAFSDVKIKELTIENNNLKELGNWTYHLVYVKLFRIVNDQITIIMNGTFDKMQELRVLILKNNQITDIEMDTFNKDFNHLTFIDLSYNKLKEIRQVFNLKKLYQIDLSYNEITNVKQDVFINCISLREIYLNYNKLVTLPDTFYEKTILRRLYLAGNRLIDTNFVNGSEYMDIIDLSDNNLETISIFNTDRMYIIYLHDNKLNYKQINDVIMNSSDTLKGISLTNNNLSCYGLLQLWSVLYFYNITLFNRYDYSDNDFAITDIGCTECTI